VIQNPVALAFILTGIVALLLQLKKVRPRFFGVLPVPFWCYALPMVLGTAGIFPSASPLYGILGRYALPFCLALLLINVDLPALTRLGRPALAALGLGAAGIAAGAALGFGLFHRGLPPESWKAVGALSASWIGGSANMLAVKEALAAPENVFAPVIVVDTFFAYGWMAFLIFLAGHQDRFDRWTGAVIPAGADPAPSAARRGIPWAGVPAAAAGLAALSIFFGDRAGPLLTAGLARLGPRLAQTFTPSAWTVLAVTTASLGASLTGRFGARADRTEGLGTFALYLLLASLGARASLFALARAPLFLAVGACILATHALILFWGGRKLRLPLFLLASASQACVGGVVSAPMVSAVYRPALSAVGLLLAVAGNVAGTYAGLLIAHFCSLWG